jgi:LysM repeat protein
MKSENPRPDTPAAAPRTGPVRRHRVSAIEGEPEDLEIQDGSGNLSRIFTFLLLLHVFLIGAVVLYNIIVEKPGTSVASNQQPAPAVDSPTPVDPTVVPRSQQMPAANVDSSASVDTVEYIVTPGQNLQSIAEATGASSEQISALNNLHENGSLYVGRKLLVPRPGSTPSVPTTAPAESVQAAAPTPAQVQVQSPVAAPAAMVAPKVDEKPATALAMPEAAAPKALDQPAGPRPEVAVAKPVPAAIPVKVEAAKPAPKVEAPAAAKPAVVKAAASSARSHQVQNGETFYAIARKHSVNVNELMRINGYTDPGKLRKGAVLKLPAK